MHLGFQVQSMSVLSEQLVKISMNSNNPNLPESLFRNIVDNAMDSVIVFDSGGGVRYWNCAAARTLGFSNYSCSRSVFDLIADTYERELLKEDFQQFIKTGNSRSAQFVGGQSLRSRWFKHLGRFLLDEH